MIRRGFLVASMPRSGSTMLCRLLADTGQLGRPEEYLNASYIGTPPTPDTLRATIDATTSPSGWFGLKAHWDYYAGAVADPGMARLLDTDKWIRITRRDRIGQAISLVLAHQTGAWVYSDAPQRNPLVYNQQAIADTLIWLVAQETAWDNHFAVHGIHPYLVTYEDLCDNPSAAVAGVCKHLGVGIPEQMPEPSTIRQANEVNAAWRERYLAETA